MTAEHQPSAGFIVPGAAAPGSPAPGSATPGAGPDPAALRAALEAVRTEVGKAVIGQDAVVTGLVICLLCRGHVLLEGIPGVAKTLLVRALAAALSLRSTRVQFTPDLMPGDVTGSLIYDAKTLRCSSSGRARCSPTCSSRTRSTGHRPRHRPRCLKRCRNGRSRSSGAPRRLPEPFLVAATQNPIEYEGTYPLPEAQLDRFLVKLTVPVPGRDDEIGILARHAAGFDPGDLTTAGIQPVAGQAELDAAAAAVCGVRVGPEVAGDIVDLCRATRQSPSLRLGASPRGATALQATSRAWAWLAGRDYVTPDDVKALARPTLRHRIQLRPEAELEGASPDGVLEAVLASVPVPR